LLTIIAIMTMLNRIIITTTSNIGSSANRPVGAVYGLDEPVRSSKVTAIFLFVTTVSWPAVGHTQPPT
jgi:hypothetical protein